MDEVKNYILDLTQQLRLQGITISQEQIDAVLKRYENSNKNIEEIKEEIDKLVKEFLLQLPVNIGNYDKKEVTLKKYEDGEEKVLTRNINIVGKAGLGYNAPTILNLGDMVGYFKNSRDTSWVSLDSFEYVICQLGKRLGIKMAETYRVYDGMLPIGIISENVATNGKLCMTSALPKVLPSLNGELLSKVNYLRERISNNVTVNNNGTPTNVPLLDNEEDMKIAIDLFLEVVKALHVKDSEYQEIRQDYFNMIMLDFLTNNVDRNKNNYGLLIGEDRISFAPLFDNSTITIPNLPQNLLQVNGYYMDKDKLLQCLIKNYPSYIGGFISRVQSEDFRMFSERICRRELTNNEFNWFWNKNFVNNLGKLNAVKMEEKDRTEEENVGIDVKRDKPPFYKKLSADKVINVTGEAGSGKSTFVKKYKNDDNYIVVDYDKIVLNPEVGSVEFELKNMLLEKRGTSLFESVRDVGLDQVRNNFTTMYGDVIAYLQPLGKTIVLDGSQLRFIKDPKAIKGELIALRPSLETCIARSLNRFMTNNPNATLEEKEKYVTARTSTLTSLNPMLNNLLNQVNKLPSFEQKDAQALKNAEEQKILREEGPKLVKTKPKKEENGGHINIIGLSLLILLVEVMTFAFIYLLIKK